MKPTLGGAAAAYPPEAPARDPWQAHAWARPWIMALLVGALQALCLLPSLHHGFVMDDAVYISENPAVVEGTSWGRYFADRSTVASDRELQWQSYRPLRTLAFRGVVATFGVHPEPFRALNLTLWSLCLLFFLRLVRALGGPPRGSLLAVVLFSLAPVHIEALVYPSALGDLVSLALQFVALDLVWRGWTQRGFAGWAARSVLAATVSSAALLAKEAAVVTPLLLVILAFERRADLRRSWKRVGIDIAVQCLVVLAFLVARTRVLDAVGHAPTTTHSVLRALWRLPWLIANYFWVSVAPLGHVPAYVLPELSAAAMTLVWAASLIVFSLVMWRGQGFVRLGFLWFMVSLAPVSNVVPLAAEMADRYALLASFGLVFIALALVKAWPQRLSRVGLPMAGAVAAIYVAAGFIEQRAWVSDASLWEKALAVEPRSPQAARNLGLIRLKQGKNLEAVKLLERALSLGSPPRKVFYFKAMALEALGQDREALRAIEQEIALQPTFGRAHAVKGGIELRQGRLEAAEASLSLARAHEPDHPSTMLLALELAVARGDAATEDRITARLLERAPQSPRFLFLRARALVRMHPDEALELTKRCLLLAPENPFCTLAEAQALAALGRAEAEASALRALRTLPEHSAEHASARALRDALVRSRDPARE